MVRKGKKNRQIKSKGKKWTREAISRRRLALFRDFYDKYLMKIPARG